MASGRFLAAMNVAIWMNMMPWCSADLTYQDWSFLTSQMGHCMKKVVKPTKGSSVGAGVFFHCSQSIGKCLDDLLYCKTYGHESEVTGNISLAIVNVVGFYGNIEVNWKPPPNRTSLFYLARLWKFSMRQGFSINITAAEFSIAHTDLCRLDHLACEQFYSGSNYGMPEHRLTFRLCGRRSPFFLFSRSPTAQLALYMESEGRIMLHYAPLVSGNVKGLSSANVKQSPTNTETKEQPGGYFLKMFREHSYFWYLKGDLRAHFEISYVIDFEHAQVLHFRMAVIDGPLVEHDAREARKTLLEETDFRWSQENSFYNGTLRSTGKICVD